MYATPFINEGVINLTGRMALNSIPACNQGAGQINVRSGATLTIRSGPLENNATITLECGGTLAYNATTLTGNLPKDNCPPSVTVNQAAGQADPTNNNPVLFTASFRQQSPG